MTAPRELADLAAELETLRRLQADTKTQLTRTRNTITIKHQEIGALELHEYQLVTTIDGRERKIDRLLDEWLTMRGAEALAEALVDEDGQPTQALPHARLI